jgi:hypothetical protein
VYHYQVTHYHRLFLQAGSLRVHGVAMPTMKGIVNVLNHIGEQKKGKQTRVLWHSLREEPVRKLTTKYFCKLSKMQSLPTLKTLNWCKQIDSGRETLHMLWGLPCSFVQETKHYTCYLMSLMYEKYSLFIFLLICMFII